MINVKVSVSKEMQLTTEKITRRFVGLIYQSVSSCSVDLSRQIHRSDLDLWVCNHRSADPPWVCGSVTTDPQIRHVMLDHAPMLCQASSPRSASSSPRSASSIPSM